MAWIGGSHNDMVVNAPGMKHLKSLQTESDNPGHHDLDTKNPDMPTLRSPHTMSRFIDRPHDAMVTNTPNVMHVKPRPSAALSDDSDESDEGEFEDDSDDDAQSSDDDASDSLMPLTPPASNVDANHDHSTAHSGAWNRSHPLDRFPSVGDEVGDGENEEDEKAVARFRNSDDTLSTFSSRQRLPEKA